MKRTSLPLQRREFITLLGGAAAAWPLAARAQQRERMRRIGVLMQHRRGRCGRTSPRRRVRAGAAANWAGPIGRNVRIEYRWAHGEADRIRRYAAELVGARAGRHHRYWRLRTRPPLQQATRTVPIVFAQRRPIRSAPACREPGATGRQRHRFHRIRIRHQRQMAGAAQARSRPALRGWRSFGIRRHTRRGRPVRRNPGGGAVARRGGEPGRRARRRRDRARRHRLRARRRMAA